MTSLHARSRWSEIRTPARAASAIPAPPLTKLGPGVGWEADFLEQSYVRLVLGDVDAAAELGWEIPWTARIPVLLSGLRDADWTLEEDERKF
jgi:hypothetical protein